MYLNFKYFFIAISMFGRVFKMFGGFSPLYGYIMCLCVCFTGKMRLCVCFTGKYTHRIGLNNTIIFLLKTVPNRKCYHAVLFPLDVLFPTLLLYITYYKSCMHIYNIYLGILYTSRPTR